MASSLIYHHPMTNLTLFPGDSLQPAIDYLASIGGGVLHLMPGVYENVRVALPFTSYMRYSNIKIRGNGQVTLRSPIDSADPVISIGQNYDNVRFLTGIEISGLEIEHLNHTPIPAATMPNRKGISLLGTDGAVINRVYLKNCPLEALYEGGINSQVLFCQASNCGHNWLSGKLSGFNLNGMNVRGYCLNALNCGIGFESASTGGMISYSVFSDCGWNAVGSSSWGQSNFKVAQCVFNKTSLGVGNGIGRLGAIQILNNTFIDSSFSWEGWKPTDAVVGKPIWFSPWTEGPTIFMGNTFSGRSQLLCNGWSTSGLIGELHVTSNIFETTLDPVVIQTVEENPAGTVINNRYYKFTDNFVSNQKVGLLHPYVPGGNGYINSPWPRFTFERNRLKPGAYITMMTNPQTTELIQ